MLLKNIKRELKKIIGVIGFVMIVGAGNFLTAIIGIVLMSFWMIDENEAEREFNELP